MGWYIARRVAIMVPVFLGATLLIYGMVFLLPGDPIAALGGDRPLSPAVAAQLRAQYHLNDPFLIQYLHYLGGIVNGDLGRAYSGLPVSVVLAQAFPVTIRLALIALTVEAVLGIGFGVIAGLRQGGIFDAAVLITSLIVIAVPIFVLGFLAQFVFGVRLGVASVTVGDQPTFARLLLPGVVLGSVSLAYVVRLTRSAVAANAHADYVRTAAATGLSRPRVVTVHILRNSLIPVVTFLGADLGALMGGAIVTEGIFNIHGVGGVLYQAVTRQEAPTVVSIVTVLVVAGAGATAMCADLGARTIREELDALRVMGVNPIQALVVPRVLAATLVSLALAATVILVGLAGAYLFCVYVQHVSPGAFAAGLTLLIGAADVTIALAKAALFGLSAGMIACYKGISVGGGPAGVGNAVNETVVFTFMALFAINVVATAVAVKVTM